MTLSSRIPGFYKLSPKEKLTKVKEMVGLTSEEADTIWLGRPPIEDVDRMVENVIGVIGIPLGIATNFLINGKDYLIPMATEEPSVVAAASNGAKIARIKGGFYTTSTEPYMDVQIQVVNVKDPNFAKMKIIENKAELIAEANTQDPVLLEMGGGAKDLSVKVLETDRGKTVLISLTVDVRDAMGANTVNRMAEYIKPMIEKICDSAVSMCVIDNYAVKRLARARAVFDKEALGGQPVIDNFLYNYSCAYYDKHRATGHNKGTLNGIIAVALATGQDTRAVESGFHSYAARNGQYRALPVWEQNEEGDLVGTLEMPVPVGIVGGISHFHPVAASCIRILGVKSARELGEVLAAVGLAQKVAAERALADEGIVRGHTKMHARTVAAMAGARGDLIDKISKQMIDEGLVRSDRAMELFAEFSGK
ncbi:MAG: hydroxymethylglutaryl-CoA reductase, degradative [Bacillota bacterium]